MVYVGVDVSKNKHDCCMIDEYGDVFRQLLQFGIIRRDLNI